MGPISFAAQPVDFNVRGMMPWHNFLSGPTSWDLNQYRDYINWMAENNFNLLVLHNYSGGAERYTNYVEPFVKVGYDGYSPPASFDSTNTARWGYLPKNPNHFIGSSKAMFAPYLKDGVFGNDIVKANGSNRDSYKITAKFLNNIIDYAHSKKIKVAIGFEYGVYPPEIFSLINLASYYPIEMLPDPTHPQSMQILNGTLDYIIKTYPRIDQIWLWQREHEIHIPKEPLSKGMEFVFNNVKKQGGLPNNDLIFSAAWSYLYILNANKYVHQFSPNIEVVAAGWGGDNQFMPILETLDRNLPKNVKLAALNPNWGQNKQPNFFSKIAKNRSIFVIPWLEGDYQLWHPQSRVSVLDEQLKLAASQKVDGVIGTHWRTSDIKLNMNFFADRLRGDLSHPESKDYIASYYSRLLSLPPSNQLIVDLISLDRDEIFKAFTSPEYLPYDWTWGRLNDPLRELILRIIKNSQKNIALAKSKEVEKELLYLFYTFKFVMELDRVSVAIEPMAKLRDMYILKKNFTRDEFLAARDSLEKAEITSLVDIYTHRVRSRGELGVLSSINQKLVPYYNQVSSFATQYERYEKK